VGFESYFANNRGLYPRLLNDLDLGTARRRCHKVARLSAIIARGDIYDQQTMKDLIVPGANRSATLGTDPQGTERQLSANRRVSNVVGASDPKKRSGDELIEQLCSFSWWMAILPTAN